MEKKGNRSVQSSSKGLVNDLSKKNQGRIARVAIVRFCLECMRQIDVVYVIQGHVTNVSYNESAGILYIAKFRNVAILRNCQVGRVKLQVSFSRTLIVLSYLSRYKV